MSPGASGVDSRQYRFTFAIEALSQVPPDFVLPPEFGVFDAGVFLPRGDVDWLGRRRYPARILLLSDRQAMVVPHPAAGEQPVRVSLDRIERVDWGRILLTGWIVLTWDGGQINLPYNTRARGPVEKCMKTLQDRWLPAAPALPAPPTCAFGAPLDLKFDYARSAELIAGETAVGAILPAPAGGRPGVSNLAPVALDHRTAQGKLWTIRNGQSLGSPVVDCRGARRLGDCFSFR
jgi:hypothetical protein